MKEFKYFLCYNFFQLFFLRKHLQEIERNIAPGLFRLTWNSLSIAEYCKKCTIILRNILGIVNNMKHFSTSLEVKVESLKNYNLFFYETIDDNPERLSSKVRYSYCFKLENLIW